MVFFCEEAPYFYGMKTIFLITMFCALASLACAQGEGAT